MTHTYNNEQQKQLPEQNDGTFLYSIYVFENSILGLMLICVRLLLICQVLHRAQYNCVWCVCVSVICVFDCLSLTAFF